MAGGSMSYGRSGGTDGSEGDWALTWQPPKESIQLNKNPGKLPRQDAGSTCEGTQQASGHSESILSGLGWTEEASVGGRTGVDTKNTANQVSTQGYTWPEKLEQSPGESLCQGLVEGKAENGTEGCFDSGD